MRLGSLGPTELILIVLVLVLIFGASKLGDIGGALGKSVKGFREATRDENATETVTRADDAVVRTERVETVSTTALPVEKPLATPVAEYRPPDSRPS
jgi:sec-independent protein translocase protein TatA